MKPKFENTWQKVLWYVLYLGSAVVAGLSLFFYHIERINLPTMISILAVVLAIEVVTGFIILVTGCFLLLSLDVIKADLMGHVTRLFLILITAFLAINQVAKAVKFAKMDEDVTNIKQLHLNVRESRAYGVEFAITSLLLAVGIKHQMTDSVTLLVVVLATFAATYLIFNHFIKKAQ